jgi:hypothetical protein
MTASRRGWAEWMHYKVLRFVYGTFNYINVIMENKIWNYKGLLRLVLKLYSEDETGQWHTRDFTCLCTTHPTVSWFVYTHDRIFFNKVVSCYQIMAFRFSKNDVF